MFTIPNVGHMFKGASLALNRNAPAVLTAFGAVGVVTTAVLTARATFQAAEKIFDENVQRGVDGDEYLNKIETVKLVWPLYIGAVSSGVLSCGAIVMSHRISSRRAAVLAAAYALNQDKLEEYQDKVKEKFGVKKEKEVRTDVHQDQVNRDYDSSQKIFSPIDGKMLIKEEYTGRYFWSTREIIENAVNQINALINSEGSARLSDFYDLIELPHVSTSDYFGFIREERLELDWDTTTTPDNLIAVHTFEYVNHPVMNPEQAANATFR